MASSKEAILMSKLGKKKPFISSDTTTNDGSDFRGMKDGLTDSGPLQGTNTTGGSLDVLKSYKAGNLGGSVPSSKILGEQSVPSTNLTGESAVPKTKKVPYSPIKNYLKTGR